MNKAQWFGDDYTVVQWKGRDLNQIMNDSKSAATSTVIKPLARYPQGQGIPSFRGNCIFNQLSNFGRGSLAWLLEM